MRFFSVFLLFFFVKLLPAQYVCDESYLDQDFWFFKNQLTQVVLDRDAKALAPLLADSVFTTYDGCRYDYLDRDFFAKEFWEQQEGFFWKEMLKILRFGFFQVEPGIDLDDFATSQAQGFRCPSFLKQVDTKEQFLILGQNVNIRAEPSLKSKVLHKASYEVFDCTCADFHLLEEPIWIENDGLTWMKFQLKNGTSAYVSYELTSESLEYQMTVEKIGGKWQITSFYSPLEC